MKCGVGTRYFGNVSCCGLGPPQTYGRRGWICRWVPGDPGSPRAGSRLWSDAGGSRYSEILLTCDLMASEYAALQGTRDTPWHCSINRVFWPERVELALGVIFQLWGHFSNFLFSPCNSTAWCFSQDDQTVALFVFALACMVAAVTRRLFSVEMQPP